MPDISILSPFVDEDPSNFDELDLSCGRFIDTWLDAGGESDDEEISLLYSLWAQSLDDRGKDEAGFFDWAYPQFIQARDDVSKRLGAVQP